MIIFRENQIEIFIRKHKLVCHTMPGWLALHYVCDADARSGYGDKKFVRVIAFENKYPLDTIKAIKTNAFNELIDSITYYEDGGYEYNEKEFKTIL